MAKRPTRPSRSTVADDPASRRPSAGNATPEVDEVIERREMKEEDAAAEETPPKGSLQKRRRPTDSLPATELRRSKRVKLSGGGSGGGGGASGQDGQLNREAKVTKGAKGKTVNMKTTKIEKIKSKTKEDGSSTAQTESEEIGASGSVRKTKASSSSAAAAAAAAAATATAALQAKKLKSYAQFAAARQSPYPAFARPTAAECEAAHRILVSIHGEAQRPPEGEGGRGTAAPEARAGCGESTSVLDALVRTILSQNTSDGNSARAKLSMDRAYGPPPAAWGAIAAAGPARLEAAIACGGLAGVKSRAIVGVLEQVHARYGEYSLDHLFDKKPPPDDANNADANNAADIDADGEAMRELLSFRGVGPKTASCVLLFCLRRPSFAVDTHVHRLSGLLGWRPAAATRDLAHAHLDARVPDRLKYALHVLFVRHGRSCAECRAGGGKDPARRCALRRAFAGGKYVGEEEEKEGEVVKGEVKGEEGDEKDEERKDLDGEKKEENEEGKWEDEEGQQLIKIEEDLDSGVGDNSVKA